VSKFFWLSFCDPEKRTGSQFLGACLIEVTSDDCAQMLLQEWLKHFPKPKVKEDSAWVATASRKASMLGCNPGGEMACMELTHLGMPLPAPVFNRLGVLMNREQIAKFDQEMLALTVGDDR
jgi:hypothetical protein